MQEEKDIWVLHFAVFFFFMGMVSLNPIISPFAIVLGAAPVIVGTLASVSSAVSLLFKPISGIIGDRGFKFELMIVGSILAILAGVIYILSSFTGNLALFAIGRGIHGLGMALFFPSSLTLAVDLAPPGRVGETLGWRSTMFGISQLFGPAFGSFVADLLGFTAAFGLTVLFSFVSVFMVVYVYRRKREHVKLHIDKETSLRWRSLLVLSFVTASIALLLNALAYSSFLTFLPAVYKEMGLETSAFGIYLSIVGGFSILTRIIGGREADKRGAALIACIGFIAISSAYLLLSFFLFPPWAYISAFLLGLGLGFVVPALQFLALGGLPSGVRNFGAGIYTMFLDVGFMAGPVVLGYYIQIKGDYRVIFPLLPLIVTFALMITFIAKIKKA
ncbi:MFS transporter [Thermococcus sp.]